MKKGLISVLICTYNAEKTIERTLKSIINQSYTNLEILIHDDQSKDNTLNIIKNVGDNRIKIIESGKKLGPYGGLNFLLDHSIGEYVAIQDHDDIRHPQKLEEQIKFLSGHPDYIACGTKWLEYNAKTNSGFVCNLTGGDFKGAGIAHTSIVYRNCGVRYNTSLVYLGDSFFIKNILQKRGKFYLLPQVLTLHYNKPDGSNYSNLRFNINKLTIQRFFDINGITFRSILKFIYYILSNLLGNKLKSKLDNLIYKKMFKIRSFEELKHDKYVCEMIGYL